MTIHEDIFIIGVFSFHLFMSTVFKLFYVPINIPAMALEISKCSAYVMFPVQLSSCRGIGATTDKTFNQQHSRAEINYLDT